MGFCQRHCTSQVADRSHGRVVCRSWPTVGGGVTIWVGTRRSTAKASNSTVHLGLVAHRDLLLLHLEMRAGKQRATATSIDAMWRLASTPGTPAEMQPG